MNKFIKVRTEGCSDYYIINVDAIKNIYVCKLYGTSATIHLNDGEEIRTKDVEPLLKLVEEPKPQQKKKTLDLDETIENIVYKLPRRKAAIYNALTHNGIRTVQDLVDFKAKGGKINGISKYTIDWVLKYAEKED